MDPNHMRRRYMYRARQTHRARGLRQRALVPVDRAGKQCAILEWKQPTGGVNEYHKGDKVLFNGVYYKSVMDDRADGTGANSWGPVGSSNPYAAGWEVTDASL